MRQLNDGDDDGGGGSNDDNDNGCGGSAQPGHPSVVRSMSTSKS